jgi:hypothetical protein
MLPEWISPTWITSFTSGSLFTELYKSGALASRASLYGQSPNTATVSGLLGGAATAALFIHDILATAPMTASTRHPFFILNLLCFRRNLTASEMLAKATPSK